jgi:hypothetical protein
MFNKNILLGLMLFCYLPPILYIALNFYGHESISHIISNKEGNINNIIFYPMIFMFFFTILYEIERKNIISLYLIIFLIVGIIGVICISIDNYIHYIFASIVFLSILLFMIMHTYININNILMSNLLYINIITLDNIILNITEDIFIQEVVYILTFGIFYIILHMI